MAGVEWFYACDGQRFGPLNNVELKQAADSGKLRPEDLVWQEGMKSWIAARAVKGLFRAESPGAAPAGATPTAATPGQGAAAASPVESPRSPWRAPAQRPGEELSQESTPSAFEGSPAVYERTREGGRAHVFDLLLDALRRRFTAGFLEVTAAQFSTAGLYGLYLAMVLVGAGNLLFAVTTRNVNWGLAGAALLASLLVLQYAAGRFLAVLTRRVPVTTGRLSSSAVLDCFALGLLAVGLGVLLYLTIYALRVGPLDLVVPAIAAFIVCLYSAIVALNPESLRLAISSETAPGEEVLGWLAFLANGAVRGTPVAFGVGVAWGVFQVGCGLVQGMMPIREVDESLKAAAGTDVLAILSPRIAAALANTRDAALTFMQGEQILLAVCALPLVAYLGYYATMLAVAVCRAWLHAAVED